MFAACMLAVITITSTGCASQSKTTRTPGDPFEKMNRRVYAFNAAFDRKLAKPLERTYKVVTPQFVKTGVANFVSNLSYPAVIMNDALQLKGMPTLRDTGRFVVNSTVGVVGFFDPASRIGLERNREDFGQTLGRWGMGHGAYLVLPFAGSTTLRDGLAKIADPFSNPLTLAEEGAARYGIAGMRMINSGSNVSTTGNPLEDAYDPYVVERSIYWQRRDYLVYDGNVPEDPMVAEWAEEAEEDLADASYAVPYYPASSWMDEY
jgi:phospholipid-binding lipoprotein MlaA